MGQLVRILQIISCLAYHYKNQISAGGVGVGVEMSLTGRDGSGLNVGSWTFP